MSGEDWLVAAEGMLSLSLFNRRLFISGGEPERDGPLTSRTLEFMGMPIIPAVICGDAVAQISVRFNEAPASVISSRKIQFYCFYYTAQAARPDGFGQDAEAFKSEPLMALYMAEHEGRLPDLFYAPRPAILTVHIGLEPQDFAALRVADQDANDISIDLFLSHKDDLVGVLGHAISIADTNGKNIMFNSYTLTIQRKAPAPK